MKKGIYKAGESVYNDKVKIKSKKRKKPSKVFQESHRRGLKAVVNIIGLCAFEMPMGAYLFTGIIGRSPCVKG